VISTLDRVFLERANALAARGIGNTSPNPPVGAVVARGENILAEGYHHRVGEAHAEPNALAAAGDARGATLYVSLEPCSHEGRTPPCTDAVASAGIVRVVVGTSDPTRFGGGAAALRARGIDVEVAHDPASRDLIEIFAGSVERDRPYVALKMATSLDGFVAPRPGASQWLTSESARHYVRSLRVAYDAVMVGAGTIRIDDPQLTIRPPRQLLRDRVRVVVCEREPVDARRAVFEPVSGYARTIVLAPAGARERFAALEGVADVVYAGESDAAELDLAAAMRALRERGIFSVLCEGGPTLAARAIASGIVDRLYWIVAPVTLRESAAVPVLAPLVRESGARRLRWERCEIVGADAVLTGTYADV
jgi:diaminohydroxyphosphoribosylaminopyrimidine deaminase/5-amino-6-(5-phosphoribosylamino)uracil reductase